MQVFSDETFNNLSWKTTNGMMVEELIEGLTVVGAEPVDYPKTDGIIIYLQAKDGNILALGIGTEEQYHNSFFVETATAKQDEGCEDKQTQGFDSNGYISFFQPIYMNLSRIADELERLVPQTVTDKQPDSKE